MLFIAVLNMSIAIGEAASDQFTNNAIGWIIFITVGINSVVNIVFAIVDIFRSIYSLKSGRQITQEISMTNAPDELKSKKILQETSFSTEVNKSTINLIEKSVATGANHPSTFRPRKIQPIPHRKKRVFRLWNSMFYNPEFKARAEATRVSRKRRAPQEANISASLDKSTSNLIEIQIPKSINQSGFAGDRKPGARRYQKRLSKWKPGVEREDSCE